MFLESECDNDKDNEEVELLKLCRDKDNDEDGTGLPAPRAEWRAAWGLCVGELNTLYAEWIAESGDGTWKILKILAIMIITFHNLSCTYT